MLSRNEVGNMNEVALVLTADRCRDRLREDWRRGAPGRLTDIYDLALVYTEALIRGCPIPAPMLPDQLEIEGLERKSYLRQS